jgi:hypothetical protein
MVVANWSRRADIVLANGKLCAFEIKSESDSLCRLPGQIDAFSRHFEKLIVVVAGRFEEAVRTMIPEGVGLWVEDAEGQLKERLRARTLPLAKEAAITLMTAAELRRLLICNGAAAARSLPRQELCQLALGLPASDLASAARDAIKRRYRCRHERFLVKRGSSGSSLSAMGALRRQDRVKYEELLQTPEPLLTLPQISGDHPLLVYAPAGPVLKRLS